MLLLCRYLSDLGYAISGTSFRVPFISKEQIDAGGVQQELHHLFCVHTKS